MNQNMMNNNGYPQPPQTPQNQFNFTIPEDPMERGFIGACIAGVVGCFLPFYTVSIWGISASAKFTDGSLNGILVVLALIAAAALLFIKIKNYAMISLGLVGFSLVYTLYQWYDISQNDMGIGSMGLGFWIILASLAGAGFCGFKIFQREKGNVAAAPAFNNATVGVPSPQPVMPPQQPMAQPPVQPQMQSAPQPMQQPMMGQPPMGQPMPPQQPTNDNQQNPNGMQ